MPGCEVPQGNSAQEGSRLTMRNRATWIDRFLDLPCKSRAVLVGIVVAVLGVAMDEVENSV